MNVVVVGIQHAQGRMEFNPTAEHRLQHGRSSHRARQLVDPERARAGGEDRPWLREFSTGPRWPCKSEASWRLARPNSRGARGRRPGLQHRAGRRQGGFADLRQQQAEVGGRRRDESDAFAPAGIDVARRDSVALVEHAERRSGHRRHPRAGTVCRSRWDRGHAAGVRFNRSGERRRRRDAGQRRPAGAESRRLWSRARRRGIIEIARSEAGSTIAGKHAVVIGRSDIVGKPVSLLLLHRHATVTCAIRARRSAGCGGHAPTSSLPRLGGRASSGDRSSSRARR